MKNEQCSLLTHFYCHQNDRRNDVDDNITWRLTMNYDDKWLRWRRQTNKIRRWTTTTKNYNDDDNDHYQMMTTMMMMKMINKPSPNDDYDDLQTIKIWWLRWQQPWRWSKNHQQMITTMTATIKMINKPINDDYNDQHKYNHRHDASLM